VWFEQEPEQDQHPERRDLVEDAPGTG
jgi:hypothetical protein